MNKIEKLIIVVVLIVSLGSLGISWNRSPLGGLSKQLNAYSGVSAYSTVSVTGNSAVEVLTRSVTRSYARVCNIGQGIVYIYKQNSNSGVVINQGHPLYSTTTTNGDNCITLGVNDPYTGALWAIADIATSTVAVESQ